MVRLAILLVLLGLTVWEWFAGARKYAYWAALTGLFVFFSLRYGQGTDYITYMGIYANVPALHTFPNFFAFQYNKIEIGFFYLISLCKMLRMHYAVFIALITLVSLLCLNRFIRRFCPLPMFALTIFYAVYSLTYMESAIRQLLPLSIALGWVLPNWVDKRRWRAIAGIVVATLLHTSAANIRLAYESGIHLGFGTDLVNGRLTGFYNEFLYRSRLCGMSNVDILLQATKYSAEIAGLAGIKGELKETFIADMILVEGRPDKVLSDMNKQPLHVWKRGRIVI